MSNPDQITPSAISKLGAAIQAFLTDSLRRMHEWSAAVWSEDAPNRAWAPRPDRIYRSVGAAFGQPR